MDSDWGIQQRLVRLLLLAKSMTGEEVARELIVVLSTGFGIGPYKLIASMRDRAGAAMRTVKVLYPRILDVGCFHWQLWSSFSHTCSHPHLANTLQPIWLTLYSHSPKARLLWRARTGHVRTAAHAGGASGK